MQEIPSTIRRLDEHGLEITWPDSSVQTLSSRTLRLNCPCASCQQNRGDTTHSAPLTGKKGALRIVEASSDESLRLLRVWAVGNYAIGIEWGDRHNTGIYTFEFLRSLRE